MNILKNSSIEKCAKDRKSSLKKANSKVFLIKYKNYDVSNECVKEFYSNYNTIDEEEAMCHCDIILQVNPSLGTNKDAAIYNSGKIPFFEFLYLSDYLNPVLVQFKIYIQKMNVVLSYALVQV